MIDIKRILCPTDFSEPAGVALETARGFAVRFGAELHVMHCVEPVPLPAAPTAAIGVTSEPVDVAGYQQHMIDRAKEALDELAQEHESRDVPIQVHLAEGRAQDEIVACAKEIGADLMVISTHGRSGLRRFIFGSVADKLIRTSPCPVLTITPGQED